jgi:hypothetical protein
VAWRRHPRAPLPRALQVDRSSWPPHPDQLPTALEQKGSDPTAADDSNKPRRVAFSGAGSRLDPPPLCCSIHVPGGESGARLGSKVFDLVPWLSCSAAASFFFLQVLWLGAFPWGLPLKGLGTDLSCDCCCSFACSMRLR